MNDKLASPEKMWILILGGSRGLGLATAQKFASHGHNLIILHRDRKADMGEIKSSFDAIRAAGVRCITYNCDALNPDRREAVLDEVADTLGPSAKLDVMVHSIAKGNLKPMSGTGSLSHQDLAVTIDAMAISLYDWCSAVLRRRLFSGDARVLAFTSEGNKKALKGYGAVAAAKAALEAICRNLALELAPSGVRVNCIQAGVTETESFARIPGSEKIRAHALKRNPFGRLTLPSDVADVVYLLSCREAAWITGTVIKVDGGESLS